MSCAYVRTLQLRTILIAALLVLTLGIVACAVDQQSSFEDFRQQAPLIAGGSVKIENGRGEVKVEGWDKPEILVEAHKFFEGNDEDRNRWMRETKIDFEGDEHHRVVKVEQPDDHLFRFGWTLWNSDRGVNLTIHLPRQVNTDLKADRGHVSVRQIAGKLDIGNDRGDVDVTELDGELRVRGDRGNLNVRDSAIRNGLRVNLDRGSAEIDLKQFSGDSELEVSRGNLSVRLPEKAAFTLDAERSRRSSFHTDFPVLAQDGFSASHIHGQVNGGGSTLRLRGDRGSIWVRKRY